MFVTGSLSGDRSIREEPGDASHPLSRGVKRSGTRGVELFADHFGGILVRLRAQREFPVPAPEDLDKEFVAVHAQGKQGRAELAALLGPDALGMIWLFEFAWAQLFGVLFASVDFRHVE